MDERELCEDVIQSAEYQEFIVGSFFTEEELARTQAECFQRVNREYAVLYVYRSGVQEADSMQMAYGRVPKCYGLMQSLGEELGIERLRRFSGFDFYGQGVLIGMVDTGIDYRHPAFLRADGTSRVVAIWDQSAREGNPPPGFLYGVEYTEAQIAAGEAPRDENGHGTFLAGVAAGKSEESEGFYGIAPLAEIVMVKLKEAKPYLRQLYYIPENVPAYSETDIMLGVHYLIELAQRRNQPLVLFLGLGTSSGNHTGNLPLSRYLNSLVYERDVCLITAAGNEGNARHHVRRSISRERQEIELQIGRENGFILEVWSPTIANLRFGLVSPSGERIEELPDLPSYTQELGFVFDRTEITVRYERQERNTYARLVLFRFSQPSSGIWRILVDGSNETEAVYDAWLPISNFITEDTFFLQPDPEITICEPGNASMILTVSGYQPETEGFYPASSRGFTATGQVVPSVTAPATNLVGPRAGGGYVTQSGTSVAAACMAGCAALFFDYVLDLRRRQGQNSPERLSTDTVLIRNLFTAGAVRSQALTYPNEEWGYGKLNLFGLFDALRIM